MIDQAEELRKIMENKVNIKKKDVTIVKKDKKKAKVVSISSGKGGVGKTSFAINFSISLRRLGYKVVIIDADIGLSNIEILAGINSKYTISDILYAEKNIFEIMSNGPEGVGIISGGSGLKELSLLEKENFSILMEEIEKLQKKVDYIIIDTGAGISKAVSDFIMASDEVIIICTPDPTSLMDSYTLIKSIISTGFNGKINIISNLVTGRNEAIEIYNKLNSTSNSFLKVQINYLGYIEKNDIVNQGVKNQTPFIISYPNSSITKKINMITTRYIKGEEDSIEKDNISFAKKLLDIFLKKR